MTGGRTIGLRGAVNIQEKKWVGGSGASPVDLRAEIQVDGALSLAWTRRSRLGWSWPGDEPPLGENSERYRVTVEGSAATLTVQAQEPAVLISSDSLGGMTGTVTVIIVQLGDFAESRPLIGTVEL